MNRSANSMNGLISSLFSSSKRKLKIEIKQELKYYVRNNRDSVYFIQRAHRETKSLKHSLLPSLQEKIINDLRKNRAYDQIEDALLGRYIELEVRKYFK